MISAFHGTVVKGPLRHPLPRPSRYKVYIFYQIRIHFLQFNITHYVSEIVKRDPETRDKNHCFLVDKGWYGDLVEISLFS